MNQTRPIQAACVLAALFSVVCTSEAAQEQAEQPAEEEAMPNVLLTPAELVETAPPVFHAHFETSEGDFTIEVHREWSPNGADRFYNLVSAGFYDDVRFFRVLSGFMAQFGINGDPEVAATWSQHRIQDDSVIQSNTRGFVSYAKAAQPNTRTTQVFINFGDNSFLDSQGFSPFGQVVEGMEVVDQLHAGYGEGAPGGQGPRQTDLQSRGNAYLEKSFPDLDYVVKAVVSVPE